MQGGEQARTDNVVAQAVVLLDVFADGRFGGITYQGHIRSAVEGKGGVDAVVGDLGRGHLDGVAQRPHVLVVEGSADGVEQLGRGNAASIGRQHGHSHGTGDRTGDGHVLHQGGS
ncbi:hypothetical protein D9M71_798940 [compost metagenome]